MHYLKSEYAYSNYVIYYVVIIIMFIIMSHITLCLYVRDQREVVEYFYIIFLAIFFCLHLSKYVYPCLP